MTGSFSHHAANKKEPARSLKRVWRLYAGLGIHSFPHSLFALLLKIAHFQELPWAIHSHNSLQKSELLFKKERCEWFACDSSESLAKNEQIACKERANRLKNSYFCMFLTNFPLFMPKSKSLPPIIGSFSESVLSDSLPLLFTKEQPWAIVSGHSWQKSDGSHSLFFTRESLFCSQKMSESLEKPMSVFPTLALWICSKCVMFMQYDSVTTWNILHTARSSSIVSLRLRPLDTTCQLE